MAGNGVCALGETLASYGDINTGSCLNSRGSVGFHNHVFALLVNAGKKTEPLNEIYDDLKNK